MADRSRTADIPTTTWGTLLRAAKAIEDHGLAQCHTHGDAEAVRGCRHASGRLCVVGAIQFVLWPGGMPADDGVFRYDAVDGPYWQTLRWLRGHLGVEDLTAWSDAMPGPKAVAAALRAAVGGGGG